MKHERKIWLLIVVLLIGIIILEFIFLGGLAALLDIFENITNGVEWLIKWIQELI